MKISCFVFFFLNVGKTVAQQFCVDTDPFPGSVCHDACVICDLNGYVNFYKSGTIPFSDPDGCVPSPSNALWIGFVAETPSLTLEIDFCNLQKDDGYAAMIFSDCPAETLVACKFVPILPNVPPPPPIVILTANNLIVGNIYWLCIMAYDPDFDNVPALCPFLVRVLDGSTQIPTPSIPPSPPAGPIKVCPNAKVEYSIPYILGAAYGWYAPNGASINGATNVEVSYTNTISLTWGTQSGQVCVWPYSPCFDVPTTCVNVVVEPLPTTVLPDTIICSENLPFYPEFPVQHPADMVGITILQTNPPLQSYLGCDSMVRQKVTILPPLGHNDGIKYICQGDCIYENGNKYCDSGSYTELLKSKAGCDSIFTFTIIEIEAKAVISPASPAISCGNPSVLLHSTGSTSGGSVTYTWKNAAWNTLANAPTYAASAPGIYHLIVRNLLGNTFCTDTATVTVVSSGNLPGATAIGGTIGCQNTTVGLQGMSPATNISWLWSGPGISPSNQNLQNPTVNLAGDYLLVVTNLANNCMSTASATVFENKNAPPASASADTLNCLKTTAALHGNSPIFPVNFLWNGPNGFVSTNRDTFSNAAGTYFLTVTDPSNGCSTVASAEIVEQKSVPTASAGPDQTLTCSVGSVVLQGSGSAAGGLNFYWIGPGLLPVEQTIAQPTANQAGEFILEITDGSSFCKSSDTVLVVSNFQKPALFPNSQPEITCDSASATILVGCQMCSGFPYDWSGPGISAANQSSPAPVVALPGNYSVVVTNPLTGCTSSISMTVEKNTTPPLVEAGPDKTLTCLGDMDVELETDGSSIGSIFLYSWAGPGVNSGNIHSYELETEQPGRFFLTIKNLENGCTALDSVLVFPNAGAPTANAGPNQSLTCSGSVAFDGSGSSQGPNFTASWSGPSGFSSNLYSPTGIMNSGIYELTILDTTNHCKAVSDLEVVIGSNPLVASAGADQFLLCNTTSVVLSSAGSTAGAGISYQWSGPTNGAGPTLTTSLSGVYTLVVSIAPGNCTAQDVVVVTDISSLPIANAGPDLTLNCTTASIQIQANGCSSGPTILYEWSGPGITAANKNLHFPTVSAAGLYEITVTDSSNGCSNSDSMQILNDANSPLASAGPDQTLTCTSPTVVLNGSASSMGSFFTRKWSGPDINFSNQNAVSPLVNLPGDYVILIENTQNGCKTTDSVHIFEEKTIPTASAGLDKKLTCSVQSVALDGSASTAASLADFLWSGPAISSSNANLNSPTVGQAGNYSLVVTHKLSGCTASDQVVVSLDTLHPTASAGPDGLLTCSILSVVLDGSASSAGPIFSINWSGPGISILNQNLQKPTVPLAGTYVLTILNAQNGCSATDQTVVLLNQNLPTASAGSDKTLTCSQPTTVLDGSGSSSGANFSYKWSGPSITAFNQNQQSPTISQLGIFQITVTNATTGCEATDLVEIFSDMAAPVFSTTTTMLTCSQPTGQISAVCTDPLATFFWDGPAIVAGNQTKSNPTVNQSGSYSVTVTGANGCTASATVVVLDDSSTPNGTTTGDTLNCLNFGQTEVKIASTTAGATFVWSGPNGLMGSGASLAAPFSGNYFVTITAPNGCTKTLSTLVVDDRQAPQAAASVSQKLDCVTLAVALDGTGSSVGSEFFYSWTTTDGQLSGPSTSLAATATKPGFYQILVTDQSNGCTAAATVLVELDPAVPTAFLIEKQDVRCFGESNGAISIDSILSGTKPFSLFFNGKLTQNLVFENLPTGVFKIELLDANGCRLETTTSILQPPPLFLDLGPDLELPLGDSVKITAFTNWKPLTNALVNWHPPLDCGDCLSDFVAPLSSTNYELTLTDSAGCSVSDAVFVKVLPVKDVFIPNIFKPESGSNAFFTVFGGRAVVKIKELKIFDRWGELVFERQNFLPNDPSSGWDGRFHGKDAAEGVYAFWCVVEFLYGEERFFEGDLTLVR